MIDLETLDTTPDGVVLTIGGVKFDPFDKRTPHSEFYFRLDVNEQMDKGRTISEDTLNWWATQDDKIINEALGDHDRTDPLTMLRALKKWYVGCDAIWAQGTTFDIVMIEQLCRLYGQPIPWSFWTVKDSRTLFGLLPKDPRKDFSFDAHNALEDARTQARCVQIAYRQLHIKS
jgi:hypothetical protein